jgi:two-component system phosphate regulon response regulator PhoB
LSVPGSRGDVLIVEDTPEAAELFATLVEREGFQPVVCGTAAEGMAAFAQAHPVAVILDWTLPDGPGIDVCRHIRAQDQAVPIIFASGRDDETSIARAMDAGADDYVPKPVRGGELLARLEAHLRRLEALRELLSGPKPAAQPNQSQLRFGTVELDLAARDVRVGGDAVHLGPMEFKLLEYLARNAGVAVSRDQILSQVYGYDADIGTERVDLLIRRLRAKLGDHSDGGALIAAVPGYGYRLDRRLPKG